MARKYVSDEELQKIIGDSDFDIGETLQSEDDGWESSSEEEDSVSMQEEHSDTEQTSSNSENSDSDIDVQDDLKFISKSGFQWDWNREHPDKPKKNSSISKAELCAFIGILLAAGRNRERKISAIYSDNNKLSSSIKAYRIMDSIFYTLVITYFKGKEISAIKYENIDK
ncbi:hypothetical protein FQA39_LY06608 [Lamprigera yunnana]|nr:hypothetical protein FQA39_LY06608 [Lamprigera yunnana]